MVSKFVRILTILAIIADVAAMMWNFRMLPEAMFGKYPILFKITKILLLPLCLLNWAQITPVFDKHIPAFVLFQWIGDIFLLWHMKIMTYIGGWCFIFGHLAMSHFFNVEWKKVPIWAYILAFIPPIRMYSLLWPRLDYHKGHDISCFFYCSILLFSAFNAICRVCKYKFTDATYLLSSFGYIFFILSDYYLIVREFALKPGNFRIETMLTYCIAQFMLTASAAVAYKDLKNGDKKVE